MAILSTAEQADMLKRMANRVIDDNRSQPLYPSYARAILNVVAVMDGVTAERDAANAKLAAIPWDALRSVFRDADNDGYYNDEVAFWLEENGVTP